VNHQNSQALCYLNKQAFLSDVAKELNRIRRYGHRASFMFIKPLITDGLTDDYEKLLYSAIKKELRDCDSVYIFEKGVYSAILPDTHEGGAEYAALRLKRSLSRQKSIGDQGPVAVQIGLLSAGPESVVNVDSLLKALKRDLERDGKCQAFFEEKKTARAGDKNQILFISHDVKSSIGLEQALEKACKILPLELGYLEALENDKKYAAVLDENWLAVNRAGVEKLQKSGVFKNIFTILVGCGNKVSLQCDLVLPRECDSKFLCYTILKAFNSLREDGTKDNKCLKRYAETLSAISAATHQMNQPLQIILGKMELLLLDLETGSLEPEDIKKVFQEIRRHVLFSADINQKINRLTKI